MKSLLLRVSLILAGILAPMMVFASDASIGGFADAGKYVGLAIGSGFAIGLAVLGGGIGQGKASAAALDGIARNPGSSDKVFVPMIIGLALIESLVIYALLIAFMLLGKIPG